MTIPIATFAAMRPLQGKGRESFHQHRGVSFSNYQAFLHSDTWKTLRERRLRIAGFKCEKCDCRRRLQVHHHTYRATWPETQVEDLRVLCRWCHAQFHNKPLPAQRKPNAAKRKQPSFLRSAKPLTSKELKARAAYSSAWERNIGGFNR
jgi:hypothetical protein